MTDRIEPPARPEADVRTKEPDKEKAARIRDLQQSISHAALGHAAAIYEARCKAVLALDPTPEGKVSRVLRTTRPKCPNCLGFGLKYELDELKFTITIRECYCVKYEVHHFKPSEPTEHVGAKAPARKS